MTEEEMKARIAELEGEKTALKNKNSELIDREKAERERADSAENAGKSELEKAQDAIKKLSSDLTKANEATAAAQLAHRNSQAAVAIREALTANNVDPVHAPVLSDYIAGKLTWDKEGVGSFLGRTIGDGLKDYFARDGLHYVKAADNSGSGATGNTGKSVTTKLTKRPTTPAEWDVLDAMPDAERNAFADSINEPGLKV